MSILKFIAPKSADERLLGEIYEWMELTQISRAYDIHTFKRVSDAPAGCGVCKAGGIVGVAFAHAPGCLMARIKERIGA